MSAIRGSRASLSNSGDLAVAGGGALSVFDCKKLRAKVEQSPS